MMCGYTNPTTVVTSNYSNCISYNFFIFCPICLKFSHKFLRTYCFILWIKKEKSKICENRVVDMVVGPLNSNVLYLFQIIMCNVFFCITAPLGVGIGVGISSLGDSPTTALISGSLQGIACGTFLYVTFFEVSKPNIIIP